MGPGKVTTTGGGWMKADESGHWRAHSSLQLSAMGWGTATLDILEWDARVLCKRGQPWQESSPGQRLSQRPGSQRAASRSAGTLTLIPEEEKVARALLAPLWPRQGFYRSPGIAHLQRGQSVADSWLILYSRKVNIFLKKLMNGNLTIKTCTFIFLSKIKRNVDMNFVPLLLEFEF
ncbi:hypothetical protein EK904_007528 [Melospiza melodia maxima]|nr:hypothetical protein EK904_007528 [Melospiza melodia maxima]